MSDIQKFFADTARIIKHDRADNNGNYDGIRASKAVAKRFVSEIPALKDVAQGIADYWLDKYIYPSETPDQEPSQKHQNWLASVLEFFDGSVSDVSAFTKDDWKEIRDEINYASEDLPLDALSSMMGILLENGNL